MAQKKQIERKRALRSLVFIAKNVSDENANDVALGCQRFVLSQAIPVLLLVLAAVVTTALLQISKQTPAMSFIVMGITSVADAGTCMSVAGALMDQKSAIQHSRASGEWPRISDGTYMSEYDKTMDVLNCAILCSIVQGFLLVFAVLCGYESDGMLTVVLGTLAAILCVVPGGIVSGLVEVKMAWLSITGTRQLTNEVE